MIVPGDMNRTEALAIIWAWRIIKAVAGAELFTRAERPRSLIPHSRQCSDLPTSEVNPRSNGTRRVTFVHLAVKAWHTV